MVPRLSASLVPGSADPEKIYPQSAESHVVGGGSSAMSHGEARTQVVGPSAVDAGLHVLDKKK